MNFNEFKAAVLEHIKAYLPEEYAECDIKIHLVTKNNEKLDAITISSPNTNIVPTIYLDGFYKDYQNGATLDSVLKHIADMRINHEVKNPLDLNTITSYDQAKENIIPKLIGIKNNAEILNKRPHRLIADIAVIYAVCIELEGNANAQVTNQLMEMWGVTEEELFNIAISNLERLYPSKIKSLNEILIEIMAADVPADVFEQLKSGIPENNIFVLTSDKNINGAAELLSKKTMDRIVNRFGEDFYILPSSIDEVLIVPIFEQNNKPEDLRQMVTEINAEVVEPSLKLSDNIYRYNAEKHEIYVVEE